MTIMIKGLLPDGNYLVFAVTDRVIPVIFFFFMTADDAATTCIGPLAQLVEHLTLKITH
jgi:hypothetical protein